MSGHNWLAAGKATCPHCHAQPNQPCVGEYGDPLTWAPAHISRMTVEPKKTLADRFPRLRDRKPPQWLTEAVDDDTDLVEAARQAFAAAVDAIEGGSNG